MSQSAIIAIDVPTTRLAVLPQNRVESARSNGLADGTAVEKRNAVGERMSKPQDGASSGDAPMEWLADHASHIYFLFGFLAVLAGMAGVMGRHKVWLVVALLLALLIPGAWFVLRGVSTETTRLEADIESLRKALVARDKEAALKHVAEDFKYQTKKKTREKAYEIALEKMKEYGIDDLRVERLEVKKVSEAEGEASVSFRLEARRGNESIYTVECPGWKFTREGDVWKLQHIALHGAKLKGTPIAADE
jgi:hypothetical protein